MSTYSTAKSILRQSAYCLALFATATILFSACAKPIAKFTSDLSDNTAPATVKFANESVKAETYIWDFGDGKTSTEPNPSHRYTVSGNYLVTLQASAKDKMAIDSHRIQIIGPINCMVEITTPYGKMVVSLSDKTPGHRDNFIKLVEEGFYNDLLFHRVIDGFMIQGGDPTSRGASKQTNLGSGGPGYQIPAEFNEELAHVKGALAAARTGDAGNPERKSSGSQFYIVGGRPVADRDLDGMQTRKGITYTSETRKAYLENGGVPFLDADYTVFGQVVEGLEVIDAISKVATSGQDRPQEDVTMQVRVIN
ncbi:MAG: peptidylprolyl isomerase [Saprospiraceae bacterium]